MTEGKRLLIALLLAPALALPSACSRVVNPATGQTEFTAMSPAQEQQIGQEQHPQILMQFGGPYDDPELQSDGEGIHVLDDGRVAWFRDPDGNTFAIEE